MNPQHPRLLVQSALLSLLLVALSGLIMRGVPFFDIGLPYDHWLHTHSHLAMLGWIYIGLLAALRKSFLANLSAEKHRLLVSSTLFCVLGMAITFPIQGYGGYSIAFSSLFLLANYLLILFFIQEHGWKSRTPSGLCLRAALLYLFLSSLGAWALGPIVAQGMKGEPLYRLAIYWYLHFQYNGWMSFALLGLFLRKMEDEGIPFDRRRARIGLMALHIACIPAFALSALWTGPGASVFLIAAGGALLQLGAFFLLFPSLRSFPSLLPQAWRWPIGISIIAFGIKLFLQAFSALPYFADLLGHQRDLVIGYLHWVFLGFMSFGLFGLFLKEGWLSRSVLTSTGLLSFLLAFILTEGLIFWRGCKGLWMDISFPYLEEAIFAATLLFPIAVIAIWCGTLIRREN